MKEETKAFLEKFEEVKKTIKTVGSAGKTLSKKECEALVSGLDKIIGSEEMEKEAADFIYNQLKAISKKVKRDTDDNLTIAAAMFYFSYSKKNTQPPADFQEFFGWVLNGIRKDNVCCLFYLIKIDIWRASVIKKKV